MYQCTCWYSLARQPISGPTPSPRSAEPFVSNSFNWASDRPPWLLDNMGIFYNWWKTIVFANCGPCQNVRFHVREGVEVPSENHCSILLLHQLSGEDHLYLYLSYVFEHILYRSTKATWREETSNWVKFSQIVWMLATWKSAEFWYFWACNDVWKFFRYLLQVYLK